MKRFFIWSLLFSSSANAQLISFGAAGVTIKGNTTLCMDSLALIPSSDLTLTNTVLNKTSTIIHPGSNPYISRVYRFTNTTPPFNGSVQFYYRDGAELNGIPESSLTLNIHNGTGWASYPVTTRDAVNNFVLTNGISNVSLNELTLANLLTPLPVDPFAFTATKQNQSALLNWTTVVGLNFRNFAVQHSINGTNWTVIGSLKVPGNSSLNNNFSFIHSKPLNGTNYYRILKVDIENNYSYSAIRSLRFSTQLETFAILGNPVINYVICLQVNEATDLYLYNADGKLILHENVYAGRKNIDVRGYAKGEYLLKANNTTKKLVIQ